PNPLVAARRHDAIIKLWAFKPYPGPLPRECIMSHLTDWRRNLLSRLLAGLVFFATLFLVGSLMTGDLPAQQNKSKKGRVEEEVDDQKPKQNPPVKEEMEKGLKQKRKVIPVEDDDAGPRKAPGKSAAADSFSGDL